MQRAIPRNHFHGRWFLEKPYTCVVVTFLTWALFIIYCIFKFVANAVRPAFHGPEEDSYT